MPDRQLELEALTLVEDVQSSDEFKARDLCPNYMVPPSIPSQRLQGLARRGHLHYDGGSWRLTKRGREYLSELRATMDDQDVIDVLMDDGDPYEQGFSDGEAETAAVADRRIQELETNIARYQQALERIAKDAAEYPMEDMLDAGSIAREALGRVGYFWGAKDRG